MVTIIIIILILDAVLVLSVLVAIAVSIVIAIGIIVILGLLIVTACFVEARAINYRSLFFHTAGFFFSNFEHVCSQQQTNNQEPRANSQQSQPLPSDLPTTNKHQPTTNNRQRSDNHVLSVGWRSQC